MNEQKSLLVFNHSRSPPECVCNTVSVVLCEVHFGFHDSNVKSRQTILRFKKEVDLVLKLDVNEELILL